MANEYTRKCVAKISYTFSTDKTLGAVGTVIPETTEIIPIGSIVTRAIAIGRTTTGAGGATVAITGGGVTLVGAQTLATNVLDGAACTDLLRAGAIVTALGYIPIVTTSSAPLAVVIGTAALTGGGFDIYLEYIQP